MSTQLVYAAETRPVHLFLLSGQSNTKHVYHSLVISKQV
jgi:hypothetical protein